MYQYANPPGMGRTRGLLPDRPCHPGWPQKRPMAAYREQTVQIRPRIQGAFENGNIGALMRGVTTDSVIRGMLPRRVKPKPLREPKTPRVVELLHKAIEWQAVLESGKIASQAEIAHREGITRARVTQIMGLIRLAPEVQQHVLAFPPTFRRPAITERSLRPITAIEARGEQIREFQRFLF